MNTEQELSKRIMRRVWRVYLIRKATSPALRLGLLAGAIIVLTQLVSVKDVVQNAFQTSGFSGLSNFLYSAFTSAESTTLSLTLLALSLVVWFIVDQVRGREFITSPVA